MVVCLHVGFSPEEGLANFNAVMVSFLVFLFNLCFYAFFFEPSTICVRTLLFLTYLAVRHVIFKVQAEMQLVCMLLILLTTYLRLCTISICSNKPVQINKKKTRSILYLFAESVQVVFNADI